MEPTIDPHAAPPPTSPALRRAAALVVLAALAGGGVWWLHAPALTPLEEAQQALEQGDRRHAADVLNGYVELHPTDVSARLLLAQSLEESDAPRAVSLLEQTVRDDSGDEDTLRRIVAIASEQRWTDVSRQALERIIERRPEDAVAILRLAELEFQAGRPAQALPLLRRQVQLATDSPAGYLLMAEVLDDLRRPQEMIEPLQAAIHIAPDEFTAHANLAYALQKAGRLEDAAAEARWCLQRRPDMASVRTILAEALLESGDLDAAERELALVLSAAPADLAARLVEADILLFRRQADAAYTRLKPLLDDHPEQPDLLSHLARAAQLSGRGEEAAALRQTLQQVVERRRSQ